MIDDLIQSLDLFSSDPVLGGVIEEAKGRIEQIEAENKRLREALETYEAIISGNNSLLEVTEHRVQHLEAENKRLRSHIAQLREAVEEGLRTYKVPMTARICEALTATEPKGWCD